MYPRLQKLPTQYKTDFRRDDFNNNNNNNSNDYDNNNNTFRDTV